MIELPDREVRARARITWRVERSMTAELFAEIEVEVKGELYRMGASGSVVMEIETVTAGPFNEYTWIARGPYTDIPARRV